MASRHPSVRTSSATTSGLILFALACGLALILLLVKNGGFDTPELPGPSDAGAVEGEPIRVTRIVDGDTLAGKDAGDQKVTVRLLGIDAPEIRHSNGTGEQQCGGDEATERLTELAPVGSTIEIIADPRADETDRYGRRLAYVKTPHTTDVARTLVSEGLVEAWVPKSEVEPERLKDYRHVMQVAQKADRGSWKHCGTLGR